MISSIRSSQNQQTFIKVLFGAIAVSMIVGPVFSIFQSTNDPAVVFATSKKNQISFQDFFAMDPAQGQHILSLASEGKEVFSKLLAEYLYAHSYQDFLKDHDCEISDQLAFSLFLETYLPQYFPTQEQRDLIVQQILKKYSSYTDFLQAHRIREQLVAAEFQKILIEFAQNLHSKVSLPLQTVYTLETAYFKLPHADRLDTPTMDELNLFYKNNIDNYATEPLLDMSVVRIALPEDQMQAYFEGAQTPWTALLVDLQQGLSCNYEELLAHHQDTLSSHNIDRSEHYDRLNPESLKTLYDHEGLFDQCMNLDFSAQTALTAVLDGNVLSILEIQNIQPSVRLSLEQAYQQVLKDYQNSQMLEKTFMHARTWAQKSESDLMPEKILNIDVSLGQVTTSHPLWTLLTQALEKQELSLDDYVIDSQSSIDHGVIVHRLKAITTQSIDNPDADRLSAHVFQSLVGLGLKERIEKDYGYHLNDQAWKTLEPLIQKAQDLEDESIHY